MDETAVELSSAGKVSYEALKQATESMSLEYGGPSVGCWRAGSSLERKILMKCKL